MKTKDRMTAGKPGMIALLALAMLPCLVQPAGAQTPALGITYNGSSVTLLWPLAEASYNLVWTTDLGSPCSWQPCTAPLSLDGSENYLTVSLPATNSQAFFQLVSNLVVVPSAPAAVTTAEGPDGYVPDTSYAYLNGTVQPNGLDTTYWFEYGTSASYGQTTYSEVVAASNAAPVAVQIEASPLTPGATYHCQIIASNSAGLSSGGDIIFTLAPVPPDAIVVTFAATSVTTSSAMLQGSMNPNGSFALGFFQWGLTTSYGSNTPNFYAQFDNYNPEGESYTLSGLAPNTTYHYRIVAYNGGPDEAIGSDATFTTSAPFQQPAPTAVTLAATSVSTNCATLNATVNPNGALTGAVFEYGTNTGYGTSTGSYGQGSGNAAGSFEVTVCDLLPNTTYHYQVVAGNNGGTGVGGDVTFTTAGGAPQPLPMVQTLAATGVTTNFATFNGTVDPLNIETHSYFEYGTTTSYGTQEELSDDGVGNGVLALQGAPGSALVPNTTYHYRIVAYSSVGTNDGADAYFTTGSTQSSPTVVTLYPLSITSTSAVLAAVVNPNGVDAQVYFQLGTTIDSLHTVGTVDAGSGGLPIVTTISVSALNQLSSYAYRAEVLQGDAPILGHLVGFTTPAMGMVSIPAGTYKIGNIIGDSDISDAIPNSVTVSAFSMDANLVSWNLWTNVYAWATSSPNEYAFAHPGWFGVAEAIPQNVPVALVDWYDCVKWCNARSEMAGLTPVYYTNASMLPTQVYRSGEYLQVNAGAVPVYANWTANGYRLPTEAEWEVAARGGVAGHRFPNGNTISESQASYFSDGPSSYDSGPSGANSHDTGNGPTLIQTFGANGYGLYDMAGNVSEWCWDWYMPPSSGAYPSGSPYAPGVGSDPRGPASSLYSARVQRGGNWQFDATFLRCAARHYLFPGDTSEATGYGDIGFRTVVKGP